MIIIGIVSFLLEYGFMGIIIYVIYKAIKNSKRKLQDDNYAQGNSYQNIHNVNKQIRVKTGNYGDKYKTINSHYSQQTLNGVGNTSTSKNIVAKTVQTSALNDHNHAYEHKVAPLEEATVMDKFEDRKEAYRERKREMKADLPKTSYSKAEEATKMNMNNRYNIPNTESSLGYGKNGDNSTPIGAYEERVTCGYCGAVNIVPRSRNHKLKCYFCRQEV